MEQTETTAVTFVDLDYTNITCLCTIGKEQTCRPLLIMKGKFVIYV